MANFARLVDKVVMETSPNPTECFHPIIAAEFISVPDEVKAGWTLDGKNWVEPEVVPVAEPYVAPVEYKKVTPVVFKQLFTSAERIAIKATLQTDPITNDFYEILDSPQLEYVDLGLSSTQDYLEYLVAMELISADRKQEILQAIVQ